MTPKEELIKEIEQSPDEFVGELLVVLRSLQQQQLELVNQTPTSSKTVLERMGGVPKQLLASGNLSDRDSRRAFITERLQQKYQQNL